MSKEPSISITLLPCPFCGGEAKLTEYHGDPKVTCADCCVYVMNPDAVKDWNTRNPGASGVAVGEDGGSVLSNSGHSHSPASAEPESASDYIPFKSGDTHCEDCPCRYGQHLRTTEPVSVDRQPDGMFVSEHGRGNWIAPTLETIGRFKRHQVISRRDWVGIVTMLEGFLKRDGERSLSESKDETP